MARDKDEPVVTNYDRYWAMAFNRPEHYPVGPQPDKDLFRPVGEWMGRLILPVSQERAVVLGAWLEVWHAPAKQQALVGTRVRVRWQNTAELNARLWGATRHVVFDEKALEAVAKGTLAGTRLNGLANVNPLESLAGARPNDDFLVRIDGPVELTLKPADGHEPILAVDRMPVEISAPYYGLVRFLGPGAAPDSFRVQHYHAKSRDFSGPEGEVLMPEVAPDSNDTRNSTAAGIERSPCNEQGWYVYGALDAAGRFLVRALAARQLLRLNPQEIADGQNEAMEYLRPKAWKKAGVKGQATQALLLPTGMHPDAGRTDWKVGDHVLLIHLYGGIGGNKTEPAAKTPLYWGHVALGEAYVVQEPLADEPSFDIIYHQIYAHNGDGVTAGAIHYSRYAGDRQWGWAGVRPIQDMLIKLDALSAPFTIWGRQINALSGVVNSLDQMAARYRIADGRGATYVGAANNCSQDSAQALYAAIRNISRVLGGSPAVRAEMSDTPEEAARLAALTELGGELQRVLLPWGSAREDWEYGTTVLGGGDGPLGTIGSALKSWRTLLPPVAARALAEAFLEQGASIYVLRTYQVGGDDPDIAPIMPNV